MSQARKLQRQLERVRQQSMKQHLRKQQARQQPTVEPTAIVVPDRHDGPKIWPTGGSDGSWGAGE